eukprot:4605673-Alexandrium_andersonii.AAC.1
MGWNNHGVAGASGRSLTVRPERSLGGRGPSSPKRPNGPLRGSESAKHRSPASQRQEPEAPRFAQCLRFPDLRHG